MDGNDTEIKRIQSVYASRDLSNKRSLNAWHRPEVRQQVAEKQKKLALLLAKALGPDL